jgi:5-methyltetrahydrofolate--homocysteine methyltransferase
MGWTLGAVEAVCLSIIVGLSVDYALHLGHAYVHSEYYDRKGRARTAVGEVGGSILGASITTMGSMLVLWFCTIYTFLVMGTIMLMTVLWSIAGSLCGLVCVMVVIGPEGNAGNIAYFFRHFILRQPEPEHHYKYSTDADRDHANKEGIEAVPDTFSDLKQVSVEASAPLEASAPPISQQRQRSQTKLQPTKSSRGRGRRRNTHGGRGASMGSALEMGTLAPLQSPASDAPSPYVEATGIADAPKPVVADEASDDFDAPYKV